MARITKAAALAKLRSGGAMGLQHMESAADKSPEEAAARFSKIKIHMEVLEAEGKVRFLPGGSGGLDKWEAV